MGSVADRIARKIASSRRSQVIDLEGWREGKKMAREVGFSDEGPVLDHLAHLEPCHALYVMTQNISSLIGEQIAEMPEARDFFSTVSDAEEEYLPEGPPMSPLTVSYFSMWSLFDVQFGSSRETMGSCILRVVRDFGWPSWLTDTVGLMQQSRMGFFVHCGWEDKDILLREIRTQEVFSCRVPAGYAGNKGEVWFARLLPPPHRLCRRHIVFTTPYVFQDLPERAFTDYLERELARMKARKKASRTDDLYGHLMKYGRGPNHWNEYIFCTYTGHRDEVIFMTGIPDILESLPHRPADWYVRQYALPKRLSRRSGRRRASCD